MEERYYVSQVTESSASHIALIGGNENQHDREGRRRREGNDNTNKHTRKIKKEEGVKKKWSSLDDSCVRQSFLYMSIFYLPLKKMISISEIPFLLFLGRENRKKKVERERARMTKKY
jgi:hypothetical protein